MKKRSKLVILSLIIIFSIVSGVFVAGQLGVFTPDTDAIYIDCEMLCSVYAVSSCPDCDPDIAYVLWDMCIHANCNN